MAGAANTSAGALRPMLSLAYMHGIFDLLCCILEPNTAGTKGNIRRSSDPEIDVGLRSVSLRTCERILLCTLTQHKQKLCFACAGRKEPLQVLSMGPHLA